MATLWEVLLAFLILILVMGAGLWIWKGCVMARREKVGQSNV